MTRESEVLKDKAQILDRMAEGYRAVQAALHRAGREALERPGVWGEGSIKDLIAHLTYWHTVATERLQKFAAGRTDEIRVFASDAEVDEVNAGVYRANKDRPLDEMLEAFHTSYLALRTAAKSIPAIVYPEDQQPSPLRNWLVGNSVAHYAEHLPDIERATAQTDGGKPAH